MRSCSFLLSPFSVLKSQYRCEIQALLALTDAAQIKKERFVASYNKVRENGLSERVIRASWRAAGICLYNPGLVLQSSQISTRPTTPTTIESVTVLNIPRSSQALFQSQPKLLVSENLSRNTRLVLKKAGKTFAEADLSAAHLEAEVETLKHQLGSAIVFRKRKYGQIDLNENFSDLNSIRAIIDREVALQSQLISRYYSINFQVASEEAAALSLESMCTEWQLQLDLYKFRAMTIW